MRTLDAIRGAASSEALAFRLEELRLRVLPRLAGPYSWVPVHGLRMYGSFEHQRYLARLRAGREERGTAHLFRELVKPGTVVVDAGAYLGYYSVLAAQIAGPTGRVYAFECSPVNHRFLLHNLRLNGLDDIVVASSAALSDARGMLPFYIRGTELTQSSLWQTRRATDVVEVRATTLDEELAGRAVDVVKLDIEGGEPRALAGMISTIAASPDLVMFVECNPSALAGAGSSAAELVAQLSQLGFEIQEIDERRRELRPVTETLLAPGSAEDSKYFVNLYCVKSERGRAAARSAT
jgi:FkbM family methyltransferase